MTRVIAVIPARYGSTRFEGKPLAMICGKPMIQHVYENASKCSQIDRLIVATDDERIERVVRGFGGEVCMTEPTHTSGTDRVAEVMRRYQSDIVVNVQGDEPLLTSEAITEALKPFFGDGMVLMSTLKTRILDHAEVTDPNVVKVVTDQKGFALYFSRSPIPFYDGLCGLSEMFRHVGIYVYTRDFLLTFSRLPQTTLEKRERLEQLRALEHGYKIQVVETKYRPIGVDTPEDIIRAERALRGRNHEAMPKDAAYRHNRKTKSLPSH